MGQTLTCVSAGPVLFTATEQGDSVTVDAILRQHAGITTYADRDKLTALHIAAKCGHHRVVSSLWVVARKHWGLDRARRLVLDVQDSLGYTPLLYAAYYGHGEVLEYLLLQGANPFLRDIQNNTVLHIIARQGHIETAQRLLATRQHYLMKNHAGVLASYPQNNGSRSVMFVDLHNGAGLTALHIAVETGNLQMFRLLARKFGADICSRIRQPLPGPACRTCVEGSTILHIAAALHHEHIIRYILHIQSRFQRLDLRVELNRDGLKPVNCIVSQGGVAAASTTEVQFMLDDTLPEAILQILYVPDRSMVVVGGGDTYMSPAFRKNLLSIMGKVLQRIKLMLACDRIAFQVSQPTQTLEAIRKDQILEFVRRVSQKKLMLEDMSDTGTDKSLKYNSYSTATSSGSQNFRSGRHNKMRSIDSHPFHQSTETMSYEVDRSRASETGIQDKKLQPVQKLTPQEFEQVIQEISKTLLLVEEVREIMKCRRKSGRRKHHGQNSQRGTDEDEEGAEEDAAWKGTIAGVVKPSMLAELFQAARFLITNIYEEGFTTVLSKGSDPQVAFSKIRSTCCILRWSLNSARQHQLKEWEKQINIRRNRSLQEPQILAEQIKQIHQREAELANKAGQPVDNRGRSFREVILQQSACEMNQQIIAKLMEANNKTRREGVQQRFPDSMAASNISPFASLADPQFNLKLKPQINVQHQQQQQSSQQPSSSLLSARSLQLVDAGAHETKLSIIREDSQENAAQQSLEIRSLGSRSSKPAMPSNLSKHTTHIDPAQLLHYQQMISSSNTANAKQSRQFSAESGSYTAEDVGQQEASQQLPLASYSSEPIMTFGALEQSVEFVENQHPNIPQVLMNINRIDQEPGTVKMPQFFPQPPSSLVDATIPHVEQVHAQNVFHGDAENNIQIQNSDNVMLNEHMRAQYGNLSEIEVSQDAQNIVYQQQQAQLGASGFGRGQDLGNEVGVITRGEEFDGVHSSIASDSKAMELLAGEKENQNFGSGLYSGGLLLENDSVVYDEDGLWTTGETIPAEESNEIGNNSAASELISRSRSQQLRMSRSQSLQDRISTRHSSKCLSASSTTEGELCSICFERVPSASIVTCGHEFCVECIFKMSHEGVDYPRCPLCRRRMRDVNAKLNNLKTQ